MPGVTPDNWINHLYAQELANKGERGFVLSRIGSSYQNPDEVYPAGPWAGHTSTLAFTGDTWGTWNTLGLQTQLAADESSIDEPYVSDDIGSFLGPPPGTPSDDPDLYARWVQLGAFQPILRLHSSTAIGCHGSTRSRRTRSPPTSCACARRWCPTPTRSPTTRSAPALPSPGRCIWITQAHRRPTTTRASTCTDPTSWSRR